MPVAIVISIGSDIGRELAMRLAADGWAVWGTSRGALGFPQLPSSVQFTSCDLKSHESILQAIDTYRQSVLALDLLIVAVRTEEPIGTFLECDADAWDDKNLV